MLVEGTTVEKKNSDGTIEKKAIRLFGVGMILDFTL